MLSRDEPVGYYLHNKICRDLKFYFMFASILLINVYYAYEQHPEDVGPSPLRQ